MENFPSCLYVFSFISKLKYGKIFNYKTEIHRREKMHLYYIIMLQLKNSHAF